MVPDYYDLAASGAEQSGEELGALRQVRGSSRAVLQAACSNNS